MHSSTPNSPIHRNLCSLVLRNEEANAKATDTDYVQTKTSNRIHLQCRQRRLEWVCTLCTAVRMHSKQQPLIAVGRRIFVCFFAWVFFFHFYLCILSSLASALYHRDIFQVFFSSSLLRLLYRVVSSSLMCVIATCLRWNRFRPLNSTIHRKKDLLLGVCIRIVYEMCICMMWCIWKTVIHHPLLSAMLFWKIFEA